MAFNFPKSGDEDVEIHLTSDDHHDTLALHSYVLALHSRWFKASLSERWNGTYPSSDGGMTIWIYQLRFAKDDANGMLIRQAKEPAPENTDFIQRKLPVNSSSTAVELHERRLHRVEAHKCMFEAMYHKVLTFSSSICDARTSMLQLAEVADAYGCPETIKIHITNHLYSSRDQVLDCCASDPLSMLELATAVKSTSVFIEASIAIIGKWGGAFEKCEPRLRAIECWELFQQKRQEFREQLVSFEMQMFQMEAAANIVGDYHVDRLAIAFYRQWLANAMEPRWGSQKLDQGYAALFRTISAKSRAKTYEPVQDISDFVYRCSPGLLGSNAAIRTVKSTIKDIFDRAAIILKPLLKDQTLRQRKGTSLTRELSFMSVNEDEVPWVENK